jgi:uncharacterized protein (TIGR03437 family)
MLASYRVWTVLAFAPVIAFVPVGAFAHSYGPPPRVTAAPGDNARACTACHSSSALNSGPGSVKITVPSGAFYVPGVKQRITVQVADPNQRRWGFELTARLGSDLINGQAGDFTPVDNFTQVICDDGSQKPCATGASFITHTSVGTRNGTRNGATFQFDWTPPATNAGPVTLFAAGNAANGDGGSTGDQIYTANVVLTPAVPAAPTVTAGNIVSAATSQAGPIAPNSWVTVYGSNLCATTRSWSENDFVNGSMPYSLEGVSVILTQFNAPRAAYISYVSPTQINFLLPSDVVPAATTLMVKNPAGTTTPLPLTVSASAPQVFTSDGKNVLGTHANGTVVGKPSPAAPGETIVVYGTGLGATNPAMVPGVVPTDAVPVATLPQVTIAGANATVVSASVVPGSAGVYAISVQVPADAANGDLPLVVKIGTGNSASTNLTVQK